MVFTPWMRSGAPNDAASGVSPMERMYVTWEPKESYKTKEVCEQARPLNVLLTRFWPAATPHRPKGQEGARQRTAKSARVSELEPDPGPFCSLPRRAYQRTR